MDDFKHQTDGLRAIIAEKDAEIERLKAEVLRMENEFERWRSQEMPHRQKLLADQKRRIKAAVSGAWLNDNTDLFHILAAVDDA